MPVCGSTSTMGTWQAWDWEGAYGHSENSVTQDQHNGINAQVLQAVIQNGSYSFLNPLSTPGVSRALAITFGNSAVAKLDTLDLRGSGGLFDLPAGPQPPKRKSTPRLKSKSAG